MPQPVKSLPQKLAKESSLFRFDLASLIYIVTSLVEWHMQKAAAEEEKLASSHKVEDDEVRDEKFNKLTRIWRITEALSKACHLQTLLSSKRWSRKK